MLCDVNPKRKTSRTLLIYVVLLHWLLQQQKNSGKIYAPLVGFNITRDVEKGISLHSLPFTAMIGKSPRKEGKYVYIIC